MRYAYAGLGTVVLGLLGLLLIVIGLMIGSPQAQVSIAQEGQLVQVSRVAAGQCSHFATLIRCAGYDVLYEQKIGCPGQV